MVKHCRRGGDADEQLALRIQDAEDQIGAGIVSVSGKPPVKRSNWFKLKNRDQNKPFRDRKKIRPPRTTNLRTAIAFDKNNQKAPGTLSKYRNGYVNAFKVKAARERLLQLGFKAPGSYKWNQQGGVMFSLPRDIPAAFTDEEAGWVCRECYLSKAPKLTKCMMEGVRAMLSFAFQLQTGKHSTPKFKANYPSVKDQFGCQTDYAPPTKSLLAEFSAEPEGLRSAYTTEFKPECGIPFPEWCVSGNINWDWSVIGCRGGPKGGLNRIKKSRTHQLVPSQGVMTTDFYGGRPKLPGINRQRGWKGVRICMCKGGKHKPPPKEWRDSLDADFNPVDPDWCTVCPLNMFSCVQDLLRADDKGRSYPGWLRKQGRFGDRDIGRTRLVECAQQWMDVQGGNPDGLKFSSNSGRKSCGKWCAELRIKYSDSFQLHGDLWSTWQKYYQRNLCREPGFQDREQSSNLDELTTALWKLARYFGRGREARGDPVNFDTNQIGLLLAANLRAMGQGAQVAAILDRH